MPIQRRGGKRAATKTTTNEPADDGEQDGRPAFNPGRPPQLNSLKRIAKEVNAVKAELHEACADGKVGLRLAEKKILTSSATNSRFRKVVAKKVDHGEDEQLFTSLADLSVSSSHDLQNVKENHYFAVPLADKISRKKEPEPKLEDYFTPFAGEEERFVPNRRTVEACLREVDRKKRTRSTSTDLKSMRRIQDKFDFLF